MLDYRYYTFLAVASERSFTRAAEKLNLSQPAVTQQIRHLQDELNIELFYFQGKQLFLTEKGKYLQSQLTLLNQDIHQLQRHLHQSDDTLVLTFGATLSIGEFLMPSLISKYLSVYPHHHIDMVVGNTEELVQQVELGKLDFAFIEGDFNQSELGFQQFSEEKYSAVCAAESSLWYQERTLADLFSSRLFIREQGSGSRKILENILQRKGVSLSSFSRQTAVGSIGAIKQLVRENKGISFLYHLCVKKELEEGILKEVPIQDLSITHPFHIVYLKKNRGTDKIKQMIRFLEEDGETAEKLLS